MVVTEEMISFEVSWLYLLTGVKDMKVSEHKELVAPSKEEELIS